MIYEDTTVCAFLTIDPVNLGHLLIIPKQHFTYLPDVDEEVGAHLFRVAMRMAKALREVAPVSCSSESSGYSLAGRGGGSCTNPKDL